jgi:ABC-2 type transport system ATP-binding protein
MGMLFELHDVTKTYGKITALRQLSVNVPPGAVGLLGPNGAGKTTLIRTLLGLINVDTGGGQVLGMDIHARRLDIRQAVGFAPEDECLFPGVVGIESVAYAGELCGMTWKHAMQRAHEVLNYVGLGEARYRPVESYSTGMKQRLKLASAIVHDPRLLILDEPTNGMDPAGRQEILELARDLASNKGMSLLFSSHLLPDVEAVCDHVLVLARGQLLIQGQIRDLKQSHDHMVEVPIKADPSRLAQSETVCDHVQVLARGQLPVQGQIQDLKQSLNLVVEVRVKADPSRFAHGLVALGCGVQAQGDLLRVRLPAGGSTDLLWQLAASSGEQIRYLRPQSSTLEQVFLKAMEESVD